jgi:protease I
MELPLSGRKVLIVAGDGYEDLELHYPRLRLIEAGASIVVGGERAGESYSGKHGYSCKADLAFRDVIAERFAAIVIPGGQMPDRLRLNDRLLEITREFVNEGRVVAAICHAPQILISAGVVAGRKMTCYASVRDDLNNAGAEYADEPVVVDPPFVTSRIPDDLPLFCREIITLIGAAERPAHRAAASRA